MSIATIALNNSRITPSRIDNTGTRRSQRAIVIYCIICVSIIAYYWLILDAGTQVIVVGCWRTVLLFADKIGDFTNHDSLIQYPKIALEK